MNAATENGTNLFAKFQKRWVLEQMVINSFSRAIPVHIAQMAQ